MPAVSIVVPVYKVEKYLDRCIKSILAQTFSDFDLVLVDDGSPDKCGEMCDEYAKQDVRIHVIHQANGGLSAARNAGIEWSLQHSDSEWITFVDSDDWIYPRYLELLLLYSIKNKLSICMAEILISDSHIDYTIVSEALFSIEKVEKAYQDVKVSAISACARLFKKKLFQSVRFPVGKIHEDRFITYKLYFQFKEVGVIHAPLYYYFANQEGIIHADWHPGKMDNLEAAEQQLSYFLEVHNEEMYRYILDDYIHLCVDDLRQIANKSQYRYYGNIIRWKLRWTLFKERKRLKYSFREQFGIYKYAYPFAMRIFRRLFM